MWIIASELTIFLWSCSSIRPSKRSSRSWITCTWSYNSLILHHFFCLPFIIKYTQTLYKHSKTFSKIGHHEHSSTSTLDLWLPVRLETWYCKLNWIMQGRRERGGQRSPAKEPPFPAYLLLILLAFLVLKFYAFKSDSWRGKDYIDQLLYMCVFVTSFSIELYTTFMLKKFLFSFQKSSQASPPPESLS